MQTDSKSHANSAIRRQDDLYRRITKRLIDFVVSLVSIILLTPIFGVVWIAIKISSDGPVFFLQERLGKDGRVFNIYKFRTMIKGAEKVGTGVFTSSSDPRVTPVGRLLRKTSMDELPQLFNVLKGEMSLVGPRPPVTYYPRKYDEYTDDQKIRFSILPGMTGHAQVVGRNTLTWDERIALDIEYVSKMSLRFDLTILLRTVITVLNSSKSKP